MEMGPKPACVDNNSAINTMNGEIQMDLEPANSVFENIKVLSINRISAPECCYEPHALDHMLKSVETNYMVHICTGCYFQAILNVPRIEMFRFSYFQDLFV